MPQKKKSTAKKDALRSEAETERLLHELQVHQIELEIQNEELRNSRAEAEAATARYTDLYDFAPTSHFTLNSQSVILQTNLAGAALLESERANLQGGRLNLFVTEPDQPAFRSFLKQVFAKQSAPPCEIHIEGKNGKTILVTINAVLCPDGQECRAVATDITELKRAEDALIRFRWLLEKEQGIKTQSVEPAYEDVTALNRDGLILKAVGANTLKQMSEDVMDLLDTSLAVYEKNGDYAFGTFVSGWCGMLDNTSRALCETDDNRKALDGGKWLCHENCWKISKAAIDSGEPVDEACCGEIRMYAVPIISGDQTIGVVSIGYGTPPQTTAEQKALTETYQLNLKTIQHHAENYKPRPPFIINAAKRRLQSIAHLIGETVELKVSEEKLRANETRYRTLFKNMTSGFALHEMIYDDQGNPVDFRFLQINPAFTQMLGFTAEQAVGRRIKDLLPEIEDHWIDPYDQVVTTGIPVNSENYSQDLGKFFDVRAFRPAPGQFATLFTDITERKQAEKELAQSEERFRMLFNTMHSGVAIYKPIEKNTDFIFMDMNPAGLRHGNLSRGEIIGRKLTDVFPHVKESGLLGVFQKVAETGEYQNLPLTQYKDSRIEQWVENDVFKLPSGLVVTVFEDVTEQRLLEEQFRQAQKMESIGQLAGGVAHDFNNSLQTILGYTEVALGNADPSEGLHADLTQIQQAALHSADLTRQLLAFARKQVIAPEQLNLNTAVETLLKMLRRLIRENIDIIWLPSTRLWPVEIDPSQLKQILTNLFVNARDAIDEVGEITITLANQIIDGSDRIETAPPGDYVQLSFSDTGCGMTGETLEHLFEPFFTTKDIDKGTGMGLATVYGIVQQNKGFITVESTPNQGTTFKIYLPRRADKKGLPETGSKTTSNQNGSETVLLVEDEAVLLDLGQLMLEGLGYTVLAANLPEEALRIAKEYTESIDLLLTDVIMPSMNGQDLALKLQDLLPDLKCLFMSGYPAEMIARDNVMTEGVQFIQKPFSTVELAAKVHSVLDG